MKCIYFILLLIFPFYVHAQTTDSVYTAAYLDKSTRFAWTTVGGDIFTLTGGKTELMRGPTLQSTDLGAVWMPRITIGGIHFWGHTDFYVTFPLSFLAQQRLPEGFTSLRYLQSIETGMRIYPRKLQPGRISPFAGISMRMLSYSHQTEGNSYTQSAPTYQKMIYPIQAGITYATPKYLFTLAAHYQTFQQISYHLTPTQTGITRFNPLSVQLSFLRYWDTDRNMRRPETINQENIKHRILEKERRLSTWYWGVGPSSALQMQKSPFLQANFPHLYNDFMGGFMPDITFGRFFHRPDINIGFSYRPFGASLKGFDDLVKTRRRSFMLESYKYLFNWLGFAPYAGITASVEQMQTHVNGRHYEETKFTPGLIMGWDIRVTKTGTGLLRTNLRWSPGLHMEIDGQKMMFNQLEFNFIQWVHFIGRSKVYRKYSKTTD